jgi:hypothetical protein
MTGWFWKDPDVNAFGAYTPSLGAGLYHVADPRQCPGIKLWSYGHGRDRAWAKEAGGDYVEIQAGPLKDQSKKGLLKPGQTHVHQEFWLPSDRPVDIHRLTLPKPKLLARQDIPRFGWVRRPIPPPPALKILRVSRDERELALAGRILRQKKEPEAAMECFGKIRKLALHPQVVVERDEALKMAGATLGERRQWLVRAGWRKDQRLVERMALLLADEGQWEAAEKLLNRTSFQKIHQRYFRTILWKRIRRALGKSPLDPPPSLGEDSLAVFGAYRDHQD